MDEKVNYQSKIAIAKQKAIDYCC